MKQTDMTERRSKRSASELATEAAMKAKSYRRKALLAEREGFAKLNLSLAHAAELLESAPYESEHLKRMKEHVNDARFAFEAELDRLIREQG